MAVAKLTKKKRLEYEQYLKSLHSEASWNETQRIKAEREERLIKEAEERAEKRGREDEKNKVLENVVKRLLINNKLTMEEIAETNEVSLEFVQQVKLKLEEK